MPHGTFGGITESGKTFGAQQIATAAYHTGKGVLVLHKELEPWPFASWQTSDPELFLRMFWAARNCLVFIEMSDAEIARNDVAFHRCFSKGRHAGHRCFFITQYPTTVHPTIRSNCHSVFLFSCAPPAAKIWAEEFNEPLLLTAPSLPQYHFIHKPSRFAPAYVSKFEIKTNPKPKTKK